MVRISSPLRASQTLMAALFPALARHRPSGLKQTQLTPDLARAFYAVHKARPFYSSLVDFMTSGPVVVSVLEAALTAAQPTAVSREIQARLG